MEEKGCAYLVGAVAGKGSDEDLVTWCRTAAAVAQLSLVAREAERAHAAGTVTGEEKQCELGGCLVKDHLQQTSRQQLL